MWAQVVPRTMESSISTTRLPRMVEEIVLSLMLTDFSRWLCSGWIKVRAIYLFLMKPTPYGMPDCLE